MKIKQRNSAALTDKFLFISRFSAYQKNNLLKDSVNQINNKLYALDCCNIVLLFHSFIVNTVFTFNKLIAVHDH